MISTPMVSVIMPVYNSAEYLAEAIKSILDQSFGDFELLAVDDGSTDGSAFILDEYAKRDTRIRVFHQKNSGVAAARNTALDHAIGRYIALMDSDDISLPERLAKQVALLDSSPNIGLCGVRCSFFGDLGEFVGACPPTDPATLKCRMLFTITISNTTLMVRRNLIERLNLRYNSGLIVTEDYDFICRLLPFCEVANIPEVLLKIRTHADSVTRRQPYDVHYRNMSRVHKALLCEMGIDASDEELAAHLSMCTRDFPPQSRYALDAVEGWLFRVINANDRTRIFDQEALVQLMADKWVSICAIADVPLIWKWRKFSHSSLLTPRSRLSLLPLACLFLRSYASMALEKSRAGRSFKDLVRPIVRRASAS